MKHLRLNFLIGVVLLPLVFSSCNDEDEKPDLPTQVSGTYDYETKLYFENGSQLQYVGDDFDDVGTAIVSKTPSGFEMKEGGEIQFRGTKLAAASNGVTFDIESQTVKFDDQNIIVEGYDGFDLGGVKYNGFYDTASKELTGYLQFEGILTDENEEEHEVTFVLEVKATKI